MNLQDRRDNLTLRFERLQRAAHKIETDLLMLGQKIAKEGAIEAEDQVLFTKLSHDSKRMLVRLLRTRASIVETDLAIELNLPKPEVPDEWEQTDD